MASRLCVCCVAADPQTHRRTGSTMHDRNVLRLRLIAAQTHKNVPQILELVGPLYTFANAVSRPICPYYANILLIRPVALPTAVHRA